MYPNFMKGGTKVKAAAAGAGKGAAANGAGAGSGGAGAAKVNYTGGKPSRDDVDWAKTNDTYWIAGKAWLKNGKEVSWDWAKEK